MLRLFDDLRVNKQGQSSFIDIQTYWLKEVINGNGIKAQIEEFVFENVIKKVNEPVNKKKS